MLPPHRQPSGITDIPNAFGTRVPPVIEGYARVLVKQAREGAHDLLEDKVEREIRRWRAALQNDTTYGPGGEL